MRAEGQKVLYWRAQVSCKFSARFEKGLTLNPGAVGDEKNRLVELSRASSGLISSLSSSNALSSSLSAC